VPTYPTGTVTFLFTDIEGSTRLLQRLGEGYDDVLERQRELIRQSCDAHGGVEFGTEGDAHFLVFGSAVDAVRAAVDAQRALKGHAWPEGGRVRVRMGLHTGEGRTMGESYVGIDVHRAARIASAGHGGQVLISDTTKTLVEHALPAAVSLRDLGRHRLKDLDHPEYLSQLVVGGLQEEFPTIRSLDARSSNLPVELSTFVGREADIEEVARLLETSRLITLTGPGGTGKTRLALEVGTKVLLDFADGVFFVPLAPISDPALVVPTIADALGVQEAGGRPVAELLLRHLEGKEVLLILDNFEQVLAAAPLVSDLLSATPGLRALVTSQAVLHLGGEQEYPVAPLALPDLRNLEVLTSFDSVALFIARAQSVNLGFALTTENAAAVAEICARLDGLPLAIELAAARSKLFAPDALLKRLESRLTVLRGGGADLPMRQQTLRDAIAWSYELLASAERALHRRLGVFVGGFSLAAAEEVAGAMDDDGIDTLEGVAALADRSLLKLASTSGGEPRFFMLETIREFALEELASSGEREDAKRRHAQLFLALAEQAEPHLTGEGQAGWLDRLVLEHDNLRAALRWAVDSGQADLARRLSGAAWRFWHFRGHLSEGRAWLAEAVITPGDASPPSTAKALEGLGGLAYWQRDYASATDAYRQALEICRAEGDDERTANALYNLAFATAATWDTARARLIMDEGLTLFEQAGSVRGVAYARLLLAGADVQEGKWASGRSLLEAAMAGFRDLGDQWGLANSLGLLGRVARAEGRADEAQASYREELERFHSAGDIPGSAMALGSLAALLAEQGDGERAALLGGAAAALEDEVGGGAPVALRGFEDPTPPARALLGDARFEEIWARGRALGLDEAARLAAEG